VFNGRLLEHGLHLDGEFIDQLRNCQHFKEGPAPWGWLVSYLVSNMFRPASVELFLVYESCNSSTLRYSAKHRSSVTSTTVYV